MLPKVKGGGRGRVGGGGGGWGGEGEGGGGRLPVGIPARGKKQYPESFYNMDTDVNSYSVG